MQHSVNEELERIHLFCFGFFCLLMLYLPVGGRDPCPLLGHIPNGVSSSCAGCCLSFTGFPSNRPGSTGIYWVLLGFHGLLSNLFGFTEFYWVFNGLYRIYWVLHGFTGFYMVLLGFTGFYWVLLDLSLNIPVMCRLKAFE